MFFAKPQFRLIKNIFEKSYQLLHKLTVLPILKKNQVFFKKIHLFEKPNLSTYLRNFAISVALYSKFTMIFGLEVFKFKALQAFSIGK